MGQDMYHFAGVLEPAHGDPEALGEGRQLSIGAGWLPEAAPEDVAATTRDEHLPGRCEDEGGATNDERRRLGGGSGQLADDAATVCTAVRSHRAGAAQRIARDAHRRPEPHERLVPYARSALPRRHEM